MFITTTYTTITVLILGNVHAVSLGMNIKSLYQRIYTQRNIINPIAKNVRYYTGVRSWY